MITIDDIHFPETEAEANVWNKLEIYHAWHSRVLLVAVMRIEREWSCYCVPVKGESHEWEKQYWRTNGNKVKESIARAAFPQFPNIPYNY